MVQLNQGHTTIVCRVYNILDGLPPIWLPVRLQSNNIITRSSFASSSSLTASTSALIVQNDNNNLTQQRPACIQIRQVVLMFVFMMHRVSGLYLVLCRNHFKKLLTSCDFIATTDESGREGVFFIVVFLSWIFELLAVQI